MYTASGDKVLVHKISGCNASQGCRRGVDIKVAESGDTVGETKIKNSDISCTYTHSSRAMTSAGESNTIWTDALKTAVILSTCLVL